MALINIDHIEKLYDEANLRHQIAASYSYGPKTEMVEGLNDYKIVCFFRMFHQAKNLLKQFQNLHKVCIDLAKGDVQKYRDRHDVDTDDEESFDPFDEIVYIFHVESVHDLSEIIETYSELHQMSLNFAQIREVADQALENAFSGNIPYRYPVEENGEVVYVPEKDLPEDVVDAIKIEGQINNVETEHSLDGYNEFYRAAMESISRNHASGDFRRCATEILGMMSY